jgi:hypothetical protein
MEKGSLKLPFLILFKYIRDKYHMSVISDKQFFTTVIRDQLFPLPVIPGVFPSFLTSFLTNDSEIRNLNVPR